MSITTMSRRSFRVVRRTHVLVAQRPVEATVGGLLGKCPVTPALVEVLLRGTDLTGTVTVTGTVDGAPASEVLTAAGPVPGTGWVALRTCDLFDCVTSITTTGLADEIPRPTIKVQFRSEGNHPVPINCDLADCVDALIEPVSTSGGKWPVTVPGGIEVQPSVIGFDDWYDFRPAVGDLWIEILEDDVDGKIWEVVGPVDEHGSWFRRTWELGVNLRNATDVSVTPAA